MKKIIVLFVGILLIVNFTPVSYFLKEEYTYSNYDGSFTMDESVTKSSDFEVVKIRYDRFLNQHPERKGQVLYRTFAIKPWRFWEWGDYIFHHERFTLPYKQPS